MQAFHQNAVQTHPARRSRGVLTTLLLACVFALWSSCGESQDPTPPTGAPAITKGLQGGDGTGPGPASQDQPEGALSTADPDHMEILTDAGVRRALVIGVQQYDDSRNNLNLTNKDAHDIADVLSQSGWQVSLMTTDSPEAIPYAPKTILQKLKVLARECEPDDTLLFYFSGHGASAILDGRSTPLLIPMGFDQERPTQTALFLKDVAAVLSDCTAKTKLAWLDACRTTLFKGQSIRGLDVGSIDWGNDLVHFYYSTAPNMVSYESAGRVDPAGNTIENGWWTHFLVSGLRGGADENGDHYVTLKELIRFVGPRLLALSAGKQEPYALSSGSTVQEVRLTRIRASSQPEPAPTRPGTQGKTNTKDPRFLIDQIRHMEVARIPDELGPMRAQAGRDPAYRAKVISALAFHLGDMLERQLASENDHDIFELLVTELAPFGEEGAAALRGSFSVSPKGVAAADLRLRIFALAAAISLPSVDHNDALREAFSRPLMSHLEEVVDRRESDFRTLDFFLDSDASLHLNEHVRQLVIDLVARSARDLYDEGQRADADRILEHFRAAIPYAQLPNQVLLEEFSQSITTGQWKQAKKPMEALLMPVAQRNPDSMRALLSDRCLERLDKLLAGCSLQFQAQAAARIEGLDELGSHLSGYGETSRERVRQWLIAQLGDLRAFKDVNGLRAWAQELTATGIVPGALKEDLRTNSNWPAVQELAISSLPSPGKIADAAPGLETTLEWIVGQDPSVADVFRQAFAERANRTIKSDREDATGFGAELELAIRFGLDSAKAVNIAYPGTRGKEDEEPANYPASLLAAEERILESLAERLGPLAPIGAPVTRLARSVVAFENAELLTRMLDQDVIADRGHSVFAALLEDTARMVPAANSESFSFLCEFLAAYSNSKNADQAALQDSIKAAQNLLLTFANAPSGDPNQLEAIAAHLGHAAPLPTEASRQIDRQALAWTPLDSPNIEARVANYLHSRGSHVDPGLAPQVFQHFYVLKDWMQAHNWNQVASAAYSSEQADGRAETDRRVDFQADVETWKNRRLLTSYSQLGKKGLEIANFTMVIDSVIGFRVSGQVLNGTKPIGNFKGDVGDEVIYLQTTQAQRHGFLFNNVPMKKADSLGVAQRYTGSFMNGGMKVSCAFLVPTSNGFPLDSLLHDADYRGRLRGIPAANNGYELSPNTVTVARKHPIDYPLGNRLKTNSAIVKGVVVLTAAAKESEIRKLKKYLGNGVYASAYINGDSKPIWTARISKSEVPFEFSIPKGTYRIQIAADCEKSIGQYKLIFDNLTLQIE